MIEAALRREQRDQKKALSLAWHTALFANNAFFGKLPDFKTIIPDTSPQHVEEQSPEMQMAVLRVLTERMQAQS